MNTQTPDHTSMLVQINPNDSSDEPVALMTATNTPKNAPKLKKLKKVDPNAPKRAC